MARSKAWHSTCTEAHRKREYLGNTSSRKLNFKRQKQGVQDLPQYKKIISTYIVTAKFRMKQ